MVTDGTGYRAMRNCLISRKIAICPHLCHQSSNISEVNWWEYSAIKETAGRGRRK